MPKSTMTSPKMPEKREWCYVMPPKVFEIAPCDCGNHETVWSEYKGRIWCPNCQKDFTPAHNGIFDGPILPGVAKMLGLSFDRYIISTKTIEKYDTDHLGWVKTDQVEADPVPVQNKVESVRP